MSVDDLKPKKEPGLPLGEFTEAEEARRAATEKDPEKDKGMPFLTKVIGLGALVAAAVFIAKKLKGKGMGPGKDGGAHICG